MLKAFFTSTQELEAVFSSGWSVTYAEGKVTWSHPLRSGSPYTDTVSYSPEFTASEAIHDSLRNMVRRGVIRIRAVLEVT